MIHKTSHMATTHSCSTVNIFHMKKEAHRFTAIVYEIWKKGDPDSGVPNRLWMNKKQKNWNRDILASFM